MKIGIITFHASYNCGSILQCIGLKTKLEELGAEVEVINFSSKEQQAVYSVKFKNNSFRNFIKNILCFPGKKKIQNHFKQYDNYINSKLDVSSPRISDKEKLKKEVDKFNMVIAGGDQVWNIKCPDFDTAYMLDFVPDNIRKISYSPSLGATNINDSVDKELYNILLQKFDQISCREKNGQKWLEELTGRKIELMPDPTLLLTKEKWTELMKPEKTLPEKNFIFYYAFAYSKQNNIVIDSFARRNNMKVYIIDSKQWYIKRLYRYKSFVLLNITGPNTFLNLMKNANYVFTTSFHGTVFSLIFEKKFVYFDNPAHEKTDDRTSFLLEKLNLMTHYIYASNFHDNILNEDINYKKVNDIISEFREEGVLYLENNIKLL